MPLLFIWVCREVQGFTSFYALDMCGTLLLACGFSYHAVALNSISISYISVTTRSDALLLLSNSWVVRAITIIMTSILRFHPLLRLKSPKYEDGLWNSGVSCLWMIVIYLRKFLILSHVALLCGIFNAYYFVNVYVYLCNTDANHLDNCVIDTAIQADYFAISLTALKSS